MSAHAVVYPSYVEAAKPPCVHGQPLWGMFCLLAIVGMIGGLFVMTVFAWPGALLTVTSLLCLAIVWQMMDHSDRRHAEACANTYRRTHTEPFDHLAFTRAYDLLMQRKQNRVYELGQAYAMLDEPPVGYLDRCFYNELMRQYERIRSGSFPMPVA